MALVWSPTDKHADISLSNGDSRATKSFSGYRSVRAVGPARNSGKWAFAMYGVGSQHGYGISEATDTAVISTYVGGAGGSLAYYTFSSGGWYVNDTRGAVVAGQGPNKWSVLACDFDANEIRYFNAAGAQVGATGTIPAGTDWLPTGTLNHAGSYIDISDDPADGWVLPAGYKRWSVNPETHHVAGTVKQDGGSVSREIRVIDAANGELLATADSIGGSFDIGLLSADPVFVQAIPAEGYRPLIKGPLTPAEIA